MLRIVPKYDWNERTFVTCHRIHKFRSSICDLYRLYSFIFLKSRIRCISKVCNVGQGQVEIWFDVVLTLSLVKGVEENCFCHSKHNNETQTFGQKSAKRRVRGTGGETKMTLGLCWTTFSLSWKLLPTIFMRMNNNE